MDNSLEDQIVPADKRIRKWLLIGLILSVILSLPLFHEFFAYFDELKRLSRSNPDLAYEKMERLLTFVAAGNALITLTFFGYFEWIGAVILRSGQYPPPGMRVIRDTRIRTGKKAKIIAALFVSFGFLILSTNFLLWWVARLFSR